MEETLAVASPIFSLGFKESITTPERTLREILLSRIVLEAVCGKTTPFYTELLEAGLINTSFDYEYFCGYGYAATIFTGESPDAKEVQNRLIARIRDLQETGIGEADFERIRKKLYGRAVMAFNDIDGIANAMVAAHFCGEGMFDEVETLGVLTLDEANERLRTSIHTDCAALAVILPKGDDVCNS